MANLPVGNYRLEVGAPGFKNYIQSGIELQVGNSAQLNVTMQVGNVSENIEVSANANLVETERNAIAQVIDERRIVDLPLNGRQATQLVLISGAAVTAPAGDQTGSKNYYSSTTISVAGGQSSATNYLLDGGEQCGHVFERQPSLPFPRRSAGIQRGNQQRARAQWTAAGRRGERGDEVGIERAAWRCLRVPAQWRGERPQLLRGDA